MQRSSVSIFLRLIAGLMTSALLTTVVWAQSGTAGQSAFTLSQSTAPEQFNIDFGDVLVGDTATGGIFLQASESNMNDLEIQEIFIENGTPDFSPLSMPPIRVAPGETVFIEAQFAPLEEGLQQDIMVIQAIDTGTGNPVQDVMVDLRGVGVVPLPVIEVDPNPLSFGEQTINTSQSAPLMVSNVGTDTLTFELGDLTGPDATEFSVPASGIVNLNPGEFVQILIDFLPRTQGAKTATLQILSNDQDQTPLNVTLQGTGVPPGMPELIVNPLMLDFGEVALGTSDILPITISNTGTLPLDVQRLTVNGQGQNSFSITQGPFMLDPGESRQVNVTFAPLLRGGLSASLDLLTNDGSESVALRGIGTVPTLMTDAQLTFLNTPVSETSIQTLVIENTGEAILRVSSLTIDGEAFAVVGPTSFNINPGASRDVDLSFTPGQAGRLTGTLIIASNDPDSPAFEVGLEGTGLGPTLTTDASVTFPNTPVAGTSTQTLVIANTGAAILRVSNLVVEGEAFAAIGPTAFDIDPGTSRDVEFSFSPDQVGLFTGTLIIESNDPDAPMFEVALEGRGDDAVQVTPLALNFGMVRVGGQPLVLGVDVNNIGGAPLTVSQVAIIGNGDFMADVTGPVQIPAGGSLRISVQFGPDEQGSQSDVLRISTDAASMPQIDVSLEGEGVAPMLTVTPQTVSFGMVTLGRTVENGLTVANTGAVPLNITGVELLGPNAADFSFSTAEMFTVDTGEQIVMQVTFMPTSAGDRSATLRISSDDPDRPLLDISLRGSVQEVLVNAPGVANAGEPVDLQFTVPPDLQPTTSTLFYRLTGQRTYISVPLTGNENSLSASIPANALTTRGVEYYAVFSNAQGTVTVPAQNAANNPRGLRVRLGNVPAPNTLAPETYAMLSVPLDVQVPTVAAVFEDDYGPYDPDVVRILRWDTQAGTYNEVPNINEMFVPGKGFWLITESGLAYDVDEVISTDAALPFRIPLPPGFSQIGNPFAFPVAWSDVIGSGVVSAPYGYDSDSGEYVPGQPCLLPWVGYFVDNPTNAPVEIRVPPREAEAGACNTASLAMRAAAAGSAVRVSATVPALGLVDTHNFLALSSGATASLPDLREAPAVGPHLRVSIVEKGARYVSITKPAEGKGQTWDLEVELVETGVGPGVRRQVELSLHTLGRLPEGYRVTVLDLDTNEAVALKEGRFGIEIRSGQRVRHLRVVVGTQAFAKEAGSLAPLKTALATVYPNPFREKAHIGYTLAAPAHVQVDIFDLLGRRVRTLVDLPHEAGRYDVSWDGRDGAGQVVPSGMYLCRLHTGSSTQARTLVLVK